MSLQDQCLLQNEGYRVQVGRLTEALGREPTPEEKLILKMGFRGGVETQADIDQLRISKLELGLTTAHQLAISC